MSFLVYLKKRGEKGRWEHVHSLLEASRAVRRFIENHPDGPIGSEWEGGKVKTLGGVYVAGSGLTKGKVVAVVSYNGRVWKPGKDGAEIRPTTEEALWDAWRRTGDFTALGALADYMDGEGIRPESAKLIRAASQARDPAVHFFYTQHGGGGYDPDKESEDEGMLRYAVSLAKAERWFEDSEGEWEWMTDDHPDRSWLDPDDGRTIWMCAAHIRKPEGEWAEPGEPEWNHESLSGIDLGLDGDPDTDPYARVVQAELALELMP
jgi:hypothetical protein